MQKEQFNNIVKDINNLLYVIPEELNELTEKFPYFPAAYLLLAKKMHSIESPFFEKALSEAATHVYDREKLYAIIERTPLVQIQEDIFESIEPGIQKLEIEVETAEEAQLKALEEDPVFEIAPYEMEMFRALSSMDEVQIQLKHEVTDSPESLGPMSFTDWLTVICGGYRVTPKERKEGNKPIVLTGKKGNISDAKQDNGFSEEDARQLAARSLEMGDNVITETFALVLAIQGKTHKAIDVYEKLCLKYPEKKPYFAAKIDELRKN